MTASLFEVLGKVVDAAAVGVFGGGVQDGPTVVTSDETRCADEVEGVDLVARLGQQPGQQADALGVSQADGSRVEADGPHVAFTGDAIRSAADRRLCFVAVPDGSRRAFQRTSEGR